MVLTLFFMLTVLLPTGARETSSDLKDAKRGGPAAFMRQADGSIVSGGARIKRGVKAGADKIWAGIKRQVHFRCQGLFVCSLPSGNELPARPLVGTVGQRSQISALTITAPACAGPVRVLRAQRDEGVKPCASAASALRTSSQVHASRCA